MCDECVVVVRNSKQLLGVEETKYIWDGGSATADWR
jgi:hypothetical protein